MQILISQTPNDDLVLPVQHVVRRPSDVPTRLDAKDCFPRLFDLGAVLLGEHAVHRLGLVVELGTDVGNDSTDCERYSRLACGKEGC